MWFVDLLGSLGSSSDTHAAIDQAVMRKLNQQAKSNDVRCNDRSGNMADPVRFLVLTDKQVVECQPRLITSGSLVASLTQAKSIRRVRVVKLCPRGTSCIFMLGWRPSPLGARTRLGGSWPYY